MQVARIKYKPLIISFQPFSSLILRRFICAIRWFNHNQFAIPPKIKIYVIFARVPSRNSHDSWKVINLETNLINFSLMLQCDAIFFFPLTIIWRSKICGLFRCGSFEWWMWAIRNGFSPKTDDDEAKIISRENWNVSHGVWHNFSPDFWCRCLFFHFRFFYYFFILLSNQHLTRWHRTSSSINDVGEIVKRLSFHMS